MISVVIATYNGEKFIKQQLETIYTQTIKPDEVIIRDDGSTDNTVAIIKKFIKNKNLINWDFDINSNNKGYKKNFYQLLKLASGDIIFFSDQDDEWYPNKVEKMVATLNKDRNILALNSGVELVDEKSGKIHITNRKNSYNSNFLFSKKPLKKINYFSLSELAISNISPGCTMCITKKLKEIFFETYDFVLPHDWYLNLLASIYGGCAFLDEVFIKYRLHSQNALGSATGKDLKSSLNFFNRNERIKEFKERISSLNKLKKEYKVDDSSFEHAIMYLKVRLQFYEKPAINSLIKLVKYKIYRERTSIKGMVWDFILAIKLEKTIYHFLK